MNEETGAVYINFSETTPALDDKCFKIVGQNAVLALSRDIAARIAPGCQVEFITAPRYFGDGYVMPIVSVSVEGETLLEFNDGFVNLQEQIK